MDVGDVKVFHGDTDTTPMGWGTYGSRTTAVGGAALVFATRKVKEKAKVIAAHLLEAAVEDMEYADGKFSVKGSPDKAKTIQEVALMAHVAWNMPKDVEAGLEASMFYDPPNFTYPFGSHLAVVEVDAETGHVDLKRYVALDDCGPQINPVIVAGQVHGGVVQGAGQALWEEAVYDESGQLLTGSTVRTGGDGDAVAASSARPQRNRRGGHDRVDRGGLQRGDGRRRAARRENRADAIDARARLARDATGKAVRLCNRDRVAKWAAAARSAGLQACPSAAGQP